MRNWLAVGVVLGFVGSVVGGCSSGPPAETVSGFCAQKAQLECQYVAGSGDMAGVCQGLSSGACTQYREMVCETDAQNATSSGLRQFNPNNVQACLTAVTNTYGNLKFGQNEEVSYSLISGAPGDMSTLDYICESVYQGDVQANGPCTTDYDCAQNGGVTSVCTPANGGSKTDVCAPENIIPDEASCGSAGDVCVSGDACVENKNTGEYLCEAADENLGGLGASCTEDSQCDPSTAGFCDIYNTKTCQAGYDFGSPYDCELFGGNVPKG